MEDYTYTPSDDDHIGFWRTTHPSIDAIRHWITEFGGSKNVVRFSILGKPNDVYYEELSEEIYWGRESAEASPSRKYERQPYSAPMTLIQTALVDASTVENWINTIQKKQCDPWEHWLWDKVVGIDWHDA